MKEKKEKFNEYITKRECPFTPEINPESKKIISENFKSEDRSQIFERLSKSKNKSSEVKCSRSKSKTSLSESQQMQINSLKNSRNKKNSFYYSDSEGNRRVRTKITIREQKFENEIYSTMNKLSNKNSNLKRSVNKKIKENVGKFKLNNLKEIFEVIFSKCNSVQDIQNLSQYGISENMKDNVILPTLHVIQERNLELNFQNFYLIANEIMNMAL